MIKIERYNGEEEFNRILRSLTIIPSNTQIVEKTGVSKGSISQIMNGKRTPTKKFIEKFKKGFNLNTSSSEKEKPLTELFFDNSNSKDYIEHLLNEIAFLRELLLKKE